MLACILIFIVIIIIIIIFIAIYCSYNNNGQNYTYYDGTYYYRGKNGFFNFGRKNQHHQRKGGFNNGIIYNTPDVPTQFNAQNFQKRSEMNRNIGRLQGNADKEMFGYFYPDDGGDDINLPNQNCTGFGEDAKCSNFYNYILKDQNNGKQSSGRIETAEQEMFMASRMSNGESSTDLPLGMVPDFLPKGDYGSYVESLVVDDRLRDNQRKWVSEMLPWSGTASMVDNLDEAVANSLDFRGLRRPQAIVQGADALFKTEIDATDLINNKPFRFNDSRPIEI